LYRFELSASDQRPAPLCDVPNDGFRCTTQLIRAIGVPAREVVDNAVDQGKELDGALVDVETLEAEHPAHIGHATQRLLAVLFGGVDLHDAVAVNVHDDDDDHFGLTLARSSSDGHLRQGPRGGRGTMAPGRSHRLSNAARAGLRECLPSECGGAPCGADNLPACDDIIDEVDDVTLDPGSDGNVGFEADQGTCTHADGTITAWTF
jgi:hypothetical protein